MTISTTRAVERCERLATLDPPPAWWRVFKLRRWLRDYRAIMALDISVHAEMLRKAYAPDWVEEVANQPNNTLRGLVRKVDDQARGAAMTPEEPAQRMVPRSERKP